ncbi:hypothetical protein L2E82_35939 [Cichorium intybus]|uniref:Uncharacterized protein n=1 Tax=Cichorium intybus TaxID=13427 RepID=A0ACB9BQ50_CICIN|nr:hypothetical protein L2E82_35939 [Cichorium intybus]
MKYETSCTMLRSLCDHLLLDLSNNVYDIVVHLNSNDQGSVFSLRGNNEIVKKGHTNVAASLMGPKIEVRSIIMSTPI